MVLHNLFFCFLLAFCTYTMSGQRHLGPIRNISYLGESNSQHTSRKRKFLCFFYINIIQPVVNTTLFTTTCCKVNLSLQFAYGFGDKTPYFHDQTFCRSGIWNNRMVIGYRGSGRVYIMEHSSLRQFGDTNWMQQDQKYGNKDCWYAEFPLIPFPAKIRIVGDTLAYSGNHSQRKPAVESWTYVDIGAGGEIIHQNMNNNNRQKVELKDN